MRLLSFTLFSLAVHSVVHVVHGQVTDDCTTSLSAARLSLDQLTSTCTALEDASCLASGLCLEVCTEIDGFETTGCRDACPYTFGGFTVSRSVIASTGVLVGESGSVPLTLLTYQHTFDAGAVGEYTYSYAAEVTATATSALEVDICLFQFNDVDCTCTQTTCADGSLASIVDCSTVVGGAVIDMCDDVVAITDDTPLLLTLYSIPTLACEGGNAVPATPSTASSRAPVAGTTPSFPAARPSAVTLPTIPPASSPSVTGQDPVASLPSVSDPETCAAATTAANALLSQLDDECTATDLTACGASSLCLQECTSVDGLEIVGCLDACSYTDGGFTVSRRITGSVLSGASLTLTSTSHTFQAGAVGEFFYIQEVEVIDETTTPLRGGSCSFSFNDVDCTCEQIACPDGVSFADIIDCSALSGGAVIDMCEGVPLTGELTLLERLFAVPLIACGEGGGTSSTTEPGATTPPLTRSPLSSPTETPEAEATTPPLTSSPLLSPTETSDPDDTPSPSTAPRGDTESLPTDSPEETEELPGGETPNKEPGEDETPTMDETKSPAPMANIVATNGDDKNDAAGPSPPPASIPGGGSTAAPVATREAGSGSISASVTIGLWLVVACVSLIQSL